MKLSFWPHSHKLVRTRGNETIIIYFNSLTGRWRRASRYRGGKLRDTTRDPHTLATWLKRDNQTRG